MQLIKGIEAHDLALYLPAYHTAIIADPHVGKEEALNKQGLLVPRLQFKELLERLETILKELTKKQKLKSLIINGDLKEEFGSISETEWRHALRLFNLIEEYAEEIILIKGNHDTILKPIAEKRNIKLKPYLKLGETLITHGDHIDETGLKGSSVIIIGHEHPAIAIANEVRKETYKCFLRGKFRRKALIVQPSFNLLKEGSDVLAMEFLSPFLQESRHLVVYAVGDTIYDFGKLTNLL